ncbi:MAG: AbrB/MazE/SpoVT family DNA-binding domain-containing protein [archaeon]
MEEEVKCFDCNGKAQLMYEELSLFGGKIRLRDQPYYKCLKCKEEFVTSDQMRQTERELNAFNITKTIVSTGRSLAITIPAEFITYYNIKKGKKVKLFPESRNSFKVKIVG